MSPTLPGRVVQGDALDEGCRVCSANVGKAGKGLNTRTETRIIGKKVGSFR